MIMATGFKNWEYVVLSHAHTLSGDGSNQIIHILNNLCVGVGVSGVTAETAQ